MCKQCSEKPVYEFTNKKKLCGRCFVNYFQKKVLYTIRKFGMIKNSDIVGYFPSNHFKGVVLEDVLKMFAKKANIELIRLSQPSTALITAPKMRSQVRVMDEDVVNKKTKFSLGINYSKKSRTSKASEQLTKIPISSTLDSESKGIIQTLIQGKENDLKKFKPVDGKIIKPLYLFLDEEVLLYAKLRKLKFAPLPTGMTSENGGLGVKSKNKKGKISEFLDDIEKKHPEVKRAIVNGYLKIVLA